MEDYIVKEVRDAGLSILKKCHYNIDDYYNYIKQHETEEIKKGRKSYSKVENAPSVAHHS
jgi:hypothetical protein